MIEIITTLALVMSATALGLSLRNSSRINSHKELHDTQKIIRSSINRCTESQLKNLQEWLIDMDKRMKALEKGETQLREAQSTIVKLMDERDEE